MVYMSQQIWTPQQMVSQRESTGESVQDNTFLKILDRSMRTEQPLESCNVQQDNGIKETEPTVLRRAHDDRWEQRDSTSETTQEICEDNAMEENLVPAPKVEQEGDKADAGLVCEEADELPVDEDSKDQTELLQGLFGEMEMFLQKLSELVSELESNETTRIVSRQGLSELQQLEAILPELLEATEAIEGTEALKVTEGFVDKLRQLMENGFAGLREIEDGQVQMKVITGLKELIRKMFHETENAKTQIVNSPGTTVSEGKSEIEQPASAIGVLADHEDTKVMIEQNAEGNTEHRQESESFGEQMTQSSLHRTEDAGVTVQTAEQVEVFSDGTDISNVEFFQVTDNKAVGSEIIMRPQVDTSVVLQQVVEKAETLLSEDKSEVVMQLKPESLGKISLKVIHERGEIMARFVAENEQVKAILESNMQLLKDSLQKNGVHIQSLSVSVGQNGEEQRGEYDGKGYSRAGAQKMDIPTVTGMEGLQQTYRPGNLAVNMFGTNTRGINLTA